jgi:hypothetical protein
MCITSLSVSALVFVVFALNFLVGFPFGGVKVGGYMGHLGMMLGSAVVGAYSYLTLPECR